MVKIALKHFKTTEKQMSTTIKKFGDPYKRGRGSLFLTGIHSDFCLVVLHSLSNLCVDFQVIQWVLTCPQVVIRSEKNFKNEYFRLKTPSSGENKKIFPINLTNCCRAVTHFKCI